MPATISPDDIVASRNDIKGGRYYYTAAKAGVRWTFSVSHDELSAFPDDAAGALARRQYVAAALSQAMLGPPDETE